MKNIFRLLFLIFTLAISPAVINAQNTSILLINVIDQNSDAILQGEVKLLNKNGEIIYSKNINQNSDIEFRGLVPGEMIVEVKAPGFAIFHKSLILKDGLNSVIFKLDIMKIEEKVSVESSVVDQRLTEAFSRMMSKQEIDSLPDEPGEIKKELQRRFGDDVTITINGFSGGQIPPKELIRSIEVSLGNFDAEFHELSRPYVNITTKASVPNLIGSLGLTYGNSALNSRNALSTKKLPEKNKLVFGFLTAPINKKASFSVSFNGISNTTEQFFIAKTAFLPPPEKASSIGSVLNVSGDFNFDIGNNFTFRANYQNSKSNLSNIGVGQLSLPEHGFFSTNKSNEIRFSLSGIIAKKFALQSRARLFLGEVKNESNSTETGIIVADSFSTGGAGINNSSSSHRYEIFQMVSFGSGNHFVKFGGQWEHQTKRLVSSDGINGQFFYKSLADYLLLRPSTYSRAEGINNFSTHRFDLSLFAQDEFRLSKRIQIGFGLRYEIQNHLSDKNNFAPRLSGAFVLDNKAKFVLRTGVGVLYNWYELDQIQSILSNNGNQSSQLIIINPGYPDPNQNGILKDKSQPSIARQADNLTTPYMFVTQTSVSMNFRKGLKFDTSYKYERGVHLFRSRDINAPINGFRPNPQYGRVVQLESSGIYFRNSISISGEGVLLKKIRVKGRYTLSKSINDFDNVFSLPTDSYNLRLDRGLSNFDRRHSASFWFDYSPYKDIRINPYIIFDSPEPYTLTTGLDNNKDTVFNDRPMGVTRNSERGNWSKTVNFSLTWSIPFMKRNLHDKEDKVPNILKYRRINLKIDINNVFNWSNLRGFVGNEISPFFRRPTSAAPARNITFSLIYTHL